MIQEGVIERPNNDYIAFAGLLTSILGFLLGWFPIFGQLIWFTGFATSVAAYRKKILLPYAKFGLFMSLMGLSLIALTFYSKIYI